MIHGQSCQGEGVDMSEAVDPTDSFEKYGVSFQNIIFFGKIKPVEAQISILDRNLFHER
jgi:hypothetical protein